MGANDSATPRMLPWIRAAAKAIRLEQRCSAARVAVERDVSESTVRRFESGVTVHIDLDWMIAAYAVACDVPPIEFWRRALELWEMSEG